MIAHLAGRNAIAEANEQIYMTSYPRTLGAKGYSGMGDALRMKSQEISVARDEDAFLIPRIFQVLDVARLAQAGIRRERHIESTSPQPACDPTVDRFIQVKADHVGNRVDGDISR